MIKMCYNNYGDNMKNVFVINGSGGVGKDTVVEFCGKYVKVKNVSAVDKIKEAAKLLGWQGTKEDKDRKMLSDLKQLSIDYNDGPTQYIIGEYNKFMDSDEDIMFVHIREPWEIKKLVEHIGCHTLLIKSNRVERIVTNKSDASVFDYDYDEIINNDGSIKELEDLVKEFLIKYGYEV